MPRVVSEGLEQLRPGSPQVCCVNGVPRLSAAIAEPAPASDVRMDYAATVEHHFGVAPTA